MSFKGAIFDLDGVIVDSVPLHYEAWHRLFTKDFGIPFSHKDYLEKVDGKPRLDSIALLLPHLSKEEIIKAGDIKQGYFLELIKAGKLKKFDETFVLIRELQQHNILLAAASSSKNTNLILAKIGLINDFKVIVTGNDFTHGKPHPEIFQKAALGLNLDVIECVVFEDALAGIQAAKAGGFLCVGIDRHNNPVNYKLADLHVTDLRQVNYKILETLFK